MKPNRWKATIVLSSDHAGISAALGMLERILLEAVARIDDPRQVRDLMIHLRAAMTDWCAIRGVDMRGWMERTRKRVG